MPGPLIRNRPNHFLESVPASLQSVLEALFPPDDVMGPAMPQTAIATAPANLVQALSPLTKGSLDHGIDVAKQFVKNPFDFLPLPNVSAISRAGKGSSYMQRNPQARELYNMLKDAAEGGIEPGRDPMKVLAAEKTQSRVPQPTKVTAPEGTRLTHTYERKNIARNPLMDELFARQQKFDEAQRLAAAKGIKAGEAPVAQPMKDRITTANWLASTSAPEGAKGLDDIVSTASTIKGNKPSPSSDRKPLLGRWHHKAGNKVGPQKNQLDAIYKKEKVGK